MNHSKGVTEGQWISLYLFYKHKMESFFNYILKGRGIVMGKFKEYDGYDGFGMAELVGKKDLPAQRRRTTLSTRSSSKSKKFM